jgi:hypothetical protein
MPGGGVARRPLHFIVMADCSGSMKGEKMQALSYALRCWRTPGTAGATVHRQRKTCVVMTCTLECAFSMSYLPELGPFR